MIKIWNNGRLYINGEHIFLEDYSLISEPVYRDRKYPALSIRYELGLEGLKSREKDIWRIRDLIKDLKYVELESRNVPELIAVYPIRDDGEDGEITGWVREFNKEDSTSMFPFLDLVFPKGTKILTIPPPDDFS